MMPAADHASTDRGGRRLRASKRGVDGRISRGVHIDKLYHSVRRRRWAKPWWWADFFCSRQNCVIRYGWCFRSHELAADEGFSAPTTLGEGSRDRVLWLLRRWTREFDSQPRSCRVTTLDKLFCHQAV